MPVASVANVGADIADPATTASIADESTPRVLLSSRRSSAVCAPGVGVAVIWTVTVAPSGSTTAAGDTLKVPSLPITLVS